MSQYLEKMRMGERISELEKENAELQHKVDTLQGFLDRDVEFDNLQKENAELKAKWLQATDEGTSWAHLKSLEKENAETRKLLKMWIEPKYDREELLYLTEQFLKDCDIDNAIQQANKGLDFDKIADEMKRDLKEE